MARRKPVKKVGANNEVLAKSRNVRTEKISVRRIVEQLEREAADLQRAVALLHRHSG